MRGDFPALFQIEYDTPAVCADRLAAGEVDVGLIPVIEYQRIDELRVVPGLAIASKKQVESVLFVSKKPIEEVKTVALDASSRTSIALIRILLRRKFLIDPEYRLSEPDLEKMLDNNDSALLIGNPALLVPRDRYFVFDLVEQWVELTGKPFVFAFWAVRQGIDMEPFLRYFIASKAYGLSHIQDIVEYAAAEIPVSGRLILDYLENKLNYDLDEENLRGLETFYRMAAAERLISRVRELRMAEYGFWAADEHRKYE
jgi:chorismate dehydratase